MDNPTPLPGPEKEFFDFLKEGRFKLQRSRSNNEFVFYPRNLAPKSGATDLEWVDASGFGTVHAVTVISRKPERGGNYNIAIVELNEGPRMISRVVDTAPEDVTIGMKVKAAIVQPDFGALKGKDQPILVFKPA